MFLQKNSLVAAFSPPIIGILVGSTALPLHAQRIDAPRSMRADPTEFETALLVTLGRNEGRRTYWLEGGTVGGLALGALGYSLGSACPADTGSCPNGLVGFLMGASVGFVIGAFIGDSIEKK
jgi:hypothetical protein